MSVGGWQLAKEKQDAGGLFVRVFAREFDGNGKPWKFRRVTQRSRAGSKAGKFGRALVWVVEEFCDRLPDGRTFGPWRSEWRWPKVAPVKPFASPDKPDVDDPDALY